MLKWTVLIASILVPACTNKEVGVESATSDTSGITTQEIKYSADGKEMIGYLAKPEEVNPGTPGVLVVHEWWGQTDYPRRRARMLAKQGYIAFAVDMYGERQTAKHPKAAGAFAKMVMQDAKTVKVPFDAALAEIKSVPHIDPDKIAAIGYCFGGSVVLEMARQGADLAGVVSFHGGLITPSKAETGKTNAAVLALNGAADSFVKAEDIAAFNQEMSKAKVNYRFINYPGAVHGFTNPAADDKGKAFGIPLAYHAEADKQSWNEMLEFFDRIFQ